MDDRGRPFRDIAAIQTRDGEYPKVGTLSCLVSWGTLAFLGALACRSAGCRAQR